MIPKIIHQIYLPGWDALPDDIKKTALTLKERNPDWDYRFYDQVSGRRYIEEHLPQYLSVYDKIDPAYYAARSDFLRYCICYIEGGFYLDMKSVANKPLDEIFRESDEMVLSQWTIRSGKPSKHPELGGFEGCEYVNFFVAAAKHSPLLAAVIERVSGNIRDYSLRDGVGKPGVLRITGPIAYTLALIDKKTSGSYRVAHMEDELSLSFSIYGNHYSHKTRLGTHYSQIARPIIKTDPVRTALAVVYFGSIKPKVERVLGKLSRAPGKLRRIAGSG